MKGWDICERVVRKYPTMTAFSADSGYRGTTTKFVENVLKVSMFISEKIKDTFKILKKRWIVEHTFAWINNFRRLSKDYEVLSASEENFIRVAMIKITLAKC